MRMRIHICVLWAGIFSCGGLRVEGSGWRCGSAWHSGNCTGAGTLKRLGCSAGVRHAPPHQNAPLGDIPRFPATAKRVQDGPLSRSVCEQGHTRPRAGRKSRRRSSNCFNGDGQEERIYFETGANENGTARVRHRLGEQRRAHEGMSYGMMIAVELDKKREFDAIWNWAHTYMLITDPKNPSVGYFAWSMNTDGTPRSTGPRRDGERVTSPWRSILPRGDGKRKQGATARGFITISGGGQDSARHEASSGADGNGAVPDSPDDPPFILPDHPWPSISSRRMERKRKRADGRGRRFSGSRAGRASRPLGRWWTRALMIEFVPNLPGGRRTCRIHLPAFYELWSRWDRWRIVHLGEGCGR